ncbi:hypothetical protein D3C81_1697530 [compost metagenome]
MGHAVEGSEPGVLANAVVNHRALLAISQFENPLGHVFVAVIDGFPSAQGLGARRFFRGADRADQFRPQRLGPLAGQGADTAGCRME